MVTTKWAYHRERRFTSNYFNFLKVLFQFKNRLWINDLMYQQPKRPNSYFSARVLFNGAFSPWVSLSKCFTIQPFTYSTENMQITFYFYFLTRQNVCTQKVSIKVNNLSLVSSLFFWRFHKSFTNVLCFRKTNVLQTEFDIQTKIWRRQTSKN